jgi:predicted NUDIX family phosphoesterase
LIRTELPADPRPEEIVIVVPVTDLEKLRAGFDNDPERVLAAIFQPGVARGMPRSWAEVDPTYKQLVGYVILRRGEDVFNYRRVRGGGETRLTGLRSLGLGGHLNLGDVTDRVDRPSLERSIRRELQEEAILTELPELRYVGILNDDRTDVSQVHLGVVVVINLDSTNVSLRDPTLDDGRFDRIAELSRRRNEFEDWSKHCLSWLGGEGGVARHQC